MFKVKYLSKGGRVTGSLNNNGHSKVSFQDSTITGSSNNNVQSKVSFKGNMTGSSNSTVSFKGSTMAG